MDSRHRRRLHALVACVLGCLLGSSSLLAQSSVAVFAAQPTLISGQQTQLKATALDAAGKALPNSNFTWTSNHPEWVSVDSTGLATAKGLGVADITVALGNLRAVARLQSLPSAVTVTPANTTMQVGDSRQFAASALDINGNPIAGVTFVWAIDGDNGGLSIAAAIDSKGFFTSSAVGNFTVRAIIYYTSYPGIFVSQLFGTAYVRIQPLRDYNLKRMISTFDIRTGLRLRQRRNTIVGNDAGQVAMNASLGGITSGLVRYDGARVNLVLSGGAPGIVQGGPVWDFSEPAINERGDILARADQVGAGSSLVLWQNGQLSTVHLDGQSLPGVQGLTDSDTISRYSLNNSGDFAFRANWRPNNSVPSVTALYRSLGGNLLLDRLPTDALPGLSSPVTFTNLLGLDNAWNLWFTATDGKVTALFREDVSGAVTKVLATGDTLSGAQVNSIGQLGVEAASGDVAVTGNTSRGAFAIRYSGASPTTPAAVYIGNNMDLMSFNRGGPVFNGYADTGAGLYTLSSSGLRKLIIFGDLAPSGEPITAVQSAFLISGGDLIAYLSTPSSAMSVVRIGARKSTLFSAGAPVEGVVNTSLLDLVPGARQGPAHILTGGNSSSVTTLDGNGPFPALLVGDTLPGGAPFYGSYTARKSPNGSLYITVDQGLYRITGGSPALVARFPQNCESGVQCSAPSIVSVNDAGQVAAIMNTSAGRRLGILEGSQFRILLRIGDSVPGAGRVNTFNDREFAIDSNGRIMVYLNGAAGSGYFLFSDGAWSPAAVIGNTNFGPALTSASNLRAAGGKFYAFQSFSNGNFFIAEWDSQWTPLVSRNAPSPNGNNVSNINGFDVNRNGDIAYVANLNGTTAIMVLTGGTTRMVYWGSEPLPTDFWLRTTNGLLDFRDDRTLYFTAWSLEDEYAAFLAEPLQ